MTTISHPELEGLDRYKFGWADSDVAGASARRGLSEEVVRDISARENEPEWMLDLRLKGLWLFGRKPMPDWGADLTGIHFGNIKYFVRSTEKQGRAGTTCPRTSRTPTTSSASPRRRSSAWSPVSRRSDVLSTLSSETNAGAAVNSSELASTWNPEVTKVSDG
jgi:hypothetical protein